MPNLTDEMVYWITERERVRKNREVLRMNPPYSADPIFQTTRFCNVHREDDTVTRWIREDWNKPTDRACKFVLGRLINLPSSLWKIRDAIAQDEYWIAREQLKAYRDLGHKIFTSAYTVSTCGQKMDKLDYVFNTAAMVDAIAVIRYSSLQHTYEDLSQVNGMGSFLAGQVIADMKNTAFHPLYHAPDWWTWSAPGPGSLRGLNWYFHGAPEGTVKSHNYSKYIQVAYEEVQPRIRDAVGELHMQDFQNCLCEFSKFMKLKRDPNGHRRNRVHYS